MSGQAVQKEKVKFELCTTMCIESQMPVLNKTLPTEEYSIPPLSPQQEHVQYLQVGNSLYNYLQVGNSLYNYLQVTI